MNNDSSRRNFGSSLYLSLLLAATLVAACGGKSDPAAAPEGQAAQQAPPSEVVVATAQRGDLPLELSYTASTRGSREVEVRSRVSGILLARRYQEGSFVKEGASLFKVDPATFQAAVDTAAGALEMEKARFVQAEREKDRIGPLYDKKGVSQRERDDSVSNYEFAKASVAAAEARLRAAKLDLSYTDVRAPISGFTSKETRSEGSLVQAGSESSLLTTIVRLDPLYVEFAMPDSEVRLLRQVRGTELGVPVTLLLGDGGMVVHPAKATLDFLDTMVEGSSATVKARASVANADASLLPGQFLRVRLDGLTLKNVVTIPTRALVQGPTGPYVWVVPESGVAEMKPVKTGYRSGERVAITEGLAGGEPVAIEGLQKIWPGAALKPVQESAAKTEAAPAAPAPDQHAGEKAGGQG